MIVPGLPSFGDIVLAIKLLKTSYKALKDSGESAAEYQESITFLESFETCIQHISEYTQNNPGDRFSANIKQQLQTLEQPCKRLSEFLTPYKSSLEAASPRPSIAKAPNKIKFAIKNSQGEVLALKTATALPSHTIMTMLILETLETAKQTGSARQCEQIADALSITPTLLNLQASVQAIEANQRNRQSVEADQLRVTVEIKQAITDVDGKLTKELQLRPTRDYAQDQEMLQKFDDLHNAINRLEGSIRGSPLEGKLTHQLEITQVAQFALEMKVHEIREILYAINAERPQSQSLFQSTLNWVANSITHVATGVGVGIAVGRQMQAVRLASKVATASPAESSEKLMFDSVPTLCEPLKPNLECDHPDYGKTFKRVAGLDCHRSGHARPFKCDFPGCDEEFSWQKDLHRHQSKHNATTFKYECPDCGGNFTRQDDFVRHQKAHHREQADMEQGRLRNIRQWKEEEEERGRKEEAQRETFSRSKQPEKKEQQTKSESSLWSIPKDTWSCCDCGSENFLGTAPYGCPVCGHSRCIGCSPGLEFEARQREPMWSCEQCGHGPYFTDLTLTCLNCEHSRCHKCHDDGRY